MPKGPSLESGRTGIGNQWGWLHHLCDRGRHVWHLAQCLGHSRCSVSQGNLNLYLGALPCNTWYNSISSMRDPVLFFCPQRFSTASVRHKSRGSLLWEYFSVEMVPWSLQWLNSFSRPVIPFIVQSFYLGLHPTLVLAHLPRLSRFAFLLPLPHTPFSPLFYLSGENPRSRPSKFNRVMTFK